MFEKADAFGWELCIDVWECDPSLLCDGEYIKRFLVDLCDDVLKMRRYGSPFVERFGLDNPIVAGYSAVQLIETSSVVCHFAEQSRSAYFDVFSCKEFDATEVIEFCAKSFKGRCAHSHAITRTLPETRNFSS